jgi:hypothetical protein
VVYRRINGVYMRAAYNVLGRECACAFPVQK